jgi:hypothetical protein
METAAATAAASEAREATRLEPLVCLFSFIIITLMSILGPLNASKTAMEQQQQHGLETQHVSSSLYVFLFFYFISFYYTNVYFRSTQRVETAMAQQQQHRLETRHVSSR